MQPCYSASIVRSIADRLRTEDRHTLASFTPAQRVALALALGERDLEMFRNARRPPLSRRDAARILDRQRQVGRRRSRCHETVIT